MKSMKKIFKSKTINNIKEQRLFTTNNDKILYNRQRYYKAKTLFEVNRH